MVARLRLDRTYARIWNDGLKGWADESLVAAYAKMKKSGFGVVDFWKSHSTIAALLMSGDAVRAALGCNTKWMDVSEQLAEVCASSRLGHKMFGFALGLVSSDKIGLFANGLLDSIVEPITAQKQENFKQQVMAEVTRLDISAALAERRTIILDYRGLQLAITTQGIAEEISLRWGNFLRARGKQTPRLPFEAEVFGDSDDDLLGMSQDVASSVSVPRNLLLKLMSEFQSSSFSDLCARKGDVIMQADRAARVDVAIGEALVGAGGDKFMMDKLMRCLPSDGRPMSYDHSSQMLEALRSQHFFGMASRSAQSMVNAVLESVANMRAGQPPLRAAFEGHLMCIFEALAHFVVQEDASVSGGKVTGELALKRRLEAMRSEGSKEPTLADLEVYHVFSWLLNDAERKQVEALTKTCLNAMSSGNAPAKRITGKKSDDEAKKKKAKIDGGGSDAVMSLFGM